MQENKRITVVDCIRGFAVVGIILIHFLEHLNFYSFPEPTPFEQGLWDTVFYLGASKMYAIFALLFGLSCYIQHDNRARHGEDFRLRFAWRMLLLFGWGLLDLVFFNGDVLVTYAVMGLLLIPLVKASNKVVIAVAALLFLQPIEVGYIIAGLINPETQPMDLGLGRYWGIAYDACRDGGFWDVAKANLTCGLQINFGWAIEHGRLTQTLMLFVIGMWLGREHKFDWNEQNNRFWKRVAMIALCVAFPVMQLLVSFVPFKEMPTVIGQGLETQFTAWRNFSMMIFYVAVLYLLYNNTRARKGLQHLEYIGKMSLTDYLLQSAVGGFLFYKWGLELHLVASHGISFLMGIAFCICLYFFCRWWMTHHRRGPLEELWKRATDI